MTGRTVLGENHLTSWDVDIEIESVLIGINGLLAVGVAEPGKQRCCSTAQSGVSMRLQEHDPRRFQLSGGDLFGFERIEKFADPVVPSEKSFQQFAPKRRPRLIP